MSSHAEATQGPEPDVAEHVRDSEQAFRLQVLEVLLTIGASRPDDIVAASHFAWQRGLFVTEARDPVINVAGLAPGIDLRVAIRLLTDAALDGLTTHDPPLVRHTSRRWMMFSFILTGQKGARYFFLTDAGIEEARRLRTARPTVIEEIVRDHSDEVRQALSRSSR